MKVPRPYCALLALLASTVSRADSVQDLLARMDRAAASFQDMTATVKWTTHIAVIDEDTTETGNVIMKKVQNQVEARIDFIGPNARTLAFSKGQAEIYLPKPKIVQVYDLGSKGEKVDRFIMLGFGTSGTELAHDYDMKVLGPDTVQGVSTEKVQLVPKNPEVQAVVARLELWIPTSGDPYPLQEKAYEKSPGDFVLAVYTDLKINPKLPKDALKLKLPPGVKFEHPQK